MQPVAVRDRHCPLAGRGRTGPAQIASRRKVRSIGSPRKGFFCTTKAHNLRWVSGIRSF